MRWRATDAGLSARCRSRPPADARDIRPC